MEIIAIENFENNLDCILKTHPIQKHTGKL